MTAMPDETDPIAAASARQRRAAEPARSTWLAANAGSGKTRVLTDRVARLLLGGVPPQNILCLTYTTAAAGEMQNRLFRQLGAWAMAEDVDLDAAIAQMRGRVPDPEDRARARRLFAAAIETPGGLKIQTIHAFCAALLRQFPLEAAVPPGFATLDAASRSALLDEVLEVLAEGPRGAALDAMAAHLSGDEGLSGLVDGVLQHATGFSPDLDPAAIARLHGLPPDFDGTALLGEVFADGDREMLHRLAEVLAESSPNDRRAGEKLAGLGPPPWTVRDLQVLEGVLLTASGAAPFTAKFSSFPTKAARGRLAPDTLARLHALMQRVQDGRARRLALAAAHRTAALHDFATIFLAEVQRRKTLLGELDFDDLVRAARRLLSDPAVAHWVLWKLDGGIDHILVDEAQDTSPVQWAVINLLAGDMATGSGPTRHRARSLFVVGDHKQSIYSFQGADPAGFGRERDRFADRLRSVGDRLHIEELQHSFRSAPAILQAVDATFAGGDAGLGGAAHHRAAWPTLPGRVDVWPPLAAPDSPAPPDWTEPVDAVAADDPRRQLAQSIAARLSALIDAATPCPHPTRSDRPLTAGDVLVLVRRRGTLFREIIAACKAVGLPIAGADRLRLTDELAAQDLLALLSFLAQPDDDLSLAAALRSPLFGWSEAELYALAQPRPGTLWAALRGRGCDTALRLADLRDRADYLRPFELLERILIRDGGRRRLLARLGRDAEEAIDALLEEALRFEDAQVPTLAGFLGWIGAEAAEIKRKPEEGGQRLRVMTVHGAKGLEAPLVILPDCADLRAKPAPPVLPGPGGVPVWPGPQDLRDGVCTTAVDRWKRQQSEERSRLLYVAMTRAESWLWVCAAGNCGPESWHARISAGVAAAPTAVEPADFPTGRGLRLATGTWPDASTGPVATPDAGATLPAWAGRAPAPEVEPPGLLRPSDLDGTKVLPGETDGPDSASARRYGRDLHLLLEHLPGTPQAGWQTLAQELLQPLDEPTTDDALTTVVAEAMALLTAPALAPLFGPDSLAEVTLVAPLADGRQLRGQVDRLLLREGRVCAVDFKTNRQVPAGVADVPEGLLRQMGGYAAALQAIYPDLQVETALLWTRTPRLMPLPAHLTSAAFARATGAPP